MGDLFHRWQRQTGAIVVTELILFTTAFTFTYLGSKSNSYKHGTFDETAIIDSAETLSKNQNASASVLSKNEIGELANRVLRVGAEASEIPGMPLRGAMMLPANGWRPVPLSLFPVAGS